MPRLGLRLRRMHTLLAIRLGDGALKLPEDVSRIHLRFAPKMDLGHMGPRKFWHHSMVRLKYHNPAVSMIVDRTLKQEEEPTLTVYFTSDGSSKTNPSSDKKSSPATNEPASDARKKSASLAWKSETDIVKELQQMTNAVEIVATAEEKQQLERLAEETARAKADQDRCLAVNAEKKRQERMLAEARGMT